MYQVKKKLWKRLLLMHSTTTHYQKLEFGFDCFEIAFFITIKKIVVLGKVSVFGAVVIFIYNHFQIDLVKSAFSLILCTLVSFLPPISLSLFVCLYLALLPLTFSSLSFTTRFSKFTFPILHIYLHSSFWLRRIGKVEKRYSCLIAWFCIRNSYITCCLSVLWRWHASNTAKKLTIEYRMWMKLALHLLACARLFCVCV